MDKSVETLRKIIMEEIFDQRRALLALGCLEEIKTEMNLVEGRVSDREDVLEDRLQRLQTKHNKALDLLKDFSIVVQDDRGADYHLLYQYKDFLEK